jgi:hypothetical protein
MSVFWFNDVVVMVDKGICGHTYSSVRGEILELLEDEQKRKQLSKMCLLIKNES